MPIRSLTLLCLLSFCACAAAPLSRADTQNDQVDATTSSVPAAVADKGTSITSTPAALPAESTNEATTSEVTAFLSIAKTETFHASASAGPGYMLGYTLYQIGGAVTYGDEFGRVRFPLSELKYPLNVFTFGIEAQLALTNSMSINGSYRRSISRFSGLTEDSDWGILHQDYPDEWDDPDSLDVFSETDTELVLHQLDIGLWRRAYTATNWWLDVGASYYLQDIDIQLSDLDQWYPSLNAAYGYEIPHDTQEGLVGTYHVTYHALFLNARAGGVHPRLGVAEFSIGVAPSIPDVLSLVHATDTDEHLLRDPPVTGRGRLSGYAVRATCDYEYPVRDNCFLRLSGDVTYMELTGRQKNYEYGTWGWTTDELIESFQVSARASLVLYLWE